MTNLRANAAAVLGSLAVLLAIPALADTAAGVAAYNSGEFAKAEALLDPPAQAGDPQAQFALGQLYADGPDDFRDLPAAIGWFQRAAETGHAEAQFQLGMRYSVGMGAERDFIQAYKWLRLAESGLGTSAPTTFLDTFVGKMAEADVAAGEAAVDAWLAAHAEDSEPVEVAAAEPEPPATPTIEAITGVIDRLDCADLSPSIAADGSVRVAGVIAKENDIEAFLAEWEAAFGSAPVDLSIDSVGELNCNVAAFIKPHRPDSPLLASVGDTSPAIAEGELVIVDITPGKASGFLYVDYFQLDGTVIHLLPEAVDGPDRVEAGQPLRLGDGTTSGFVWRAAPPFGQELIAAFISDQPLFDAPRRVEEPAAEYLVSLGELVEASDADLFADYLIITTAPR